MKKKIKRPFSIEEWNKTNTKVETCNGKSVRILCTNIKSEYPIIAAITCNDGSEYTSAFDVEGHFCKGKSIDEDLVIVEEIEVPERFADDKKAKGEGWTISRNYEAGLRFCNGLFLNEEYNYDVFATEKQAKSALAMARISQLLANDKRYGGVVTDEEWIESKMKYVIFRLLGKIECCELAQAYKLLAFHTPEQRELFLAENEQLVKDYLMID